MLTNQIDAKAETEKRLKKEKEEREEAINEMNRTYKEG